MFKTRAKKAEEEAKQDPNYIPTKELKADEEKPQYKVPWTGLFIIGGIVILMVVCIIVIAIFSNK